MVWGGGRRRVGKLRHLQLGCDLFSFVPEFFPANIGCACVFSVFAKGLCLLY